MTNNLPVPENGKLPPPPRLTKAERDERLRETKEAIHAFLEEHKTDNSERAYVAGIRYFWTWCWYTWGSEYVDGEDIIPKPIYPVPEPLIEAYVHGQLEGFYKETQIAMVKLGVLKLSKEEKEKIKREKEKKAKDKNYKPKFIYHTSKLSTIEQRLWALNRAHQEHVSNIDERYVYTATVRKLLKAARKDRKHRKEKSTALVREMLMELIEALDDMELIYATMMRAMLSVGFAAGGRRVSELVSLTPNDITRRDSTDYPGWFFELTLGKSKTRKAADDVKVLPVRGQAANWLMEWIRLREELGVSGPPLFRAVRITQGKNRKSGERETRGHVQKGISAAWFWKHIRALAQKAGIEGRITPHSIRAGYSTQAVRDGINPKDAMEMTDHKSMTVFMGYVHAENLLDSDAGKLL